ncbi:MAG: hypothetical protein Q8L14_12460 [Myxococcales bacterium]|nr:hypothetical protein [Myxococcales bacterium]
MPAPIGRVPSTPTTSTASVTTAAKTWAEGFNFGSTSAVGRLDIARTKAPTTGPESVQRAYALYRSWEDNDLGSVRLLKTTANGQPVYALHTTTDGDDGFLEVFSEKGALLASGTTGFDAAGKRNVTWDTTPGAVRERVAPRDVSPSVEAFATAIDDAKHSSSASGSTVSTKELRDAAKGLVGNELTIASVDGWEKAGLLRLLADPASKLTSTSRAYAEQLANLYTDARSTTVSRFSSKPLGTGSAFQTGATLASGTVGVTGAPPRLNTMVQFSQKAFGVLPSQVVPLTRSEAHAMLRQAGATTAEAKAAVDALADASGTVFGGRSYEQGADWMPKAKGVVLFGVSSSGRELKALHVPVAPAPVVGPVPKDLIKTLLGVDRPVEVTGTRTTPTGTQFDLKWLPPTGGAIVAKLNVPRNGSDATIEGLTLPSLGMTEQALAARLDTALGVPQQVLGSGSVRAAPGFGVGFAAAHRPVAGGPITLSTIQVASGGASAEVKPKRLGTSATDVELARQLSLGLARTHAETMVADPGISDAARLEVALRTRWASFADLQQVDPADSAVGFDAVKDRVQFMLPSVWGDNAVFVTFQKDGAVRLEDFN